MALVTVSRSPSSSNSSSTISISETDDDSDDRLKKSWDTLGNKVIDNNKETKKQEAAKQRGRRRSSFFAVKGAALFLPRGTDCRPIKKNPVVGDLQVHLQSMFVLLRPEDSITLAVRLESIHEYRIRYLVLVSCVGVEDTEENVLLGVDFMKRNATVGLVLPVWADTEITLNGDGGFTFKAENRLHIFKPVSVQAMWSALQALNKACENARKHTYFSGGLNLTWTGYYDSRVNSKTECIKEWNMLPDIESHETIEHKVQREGYSIGAIVIFMDCNQTKIGNYRPSAKELTERLIVVKLREVLLTVDIEEVTSKEVRMKLEEVVGNDLKEFKGFIDEQMIIILRQMDSPSQIFDFLYLGSEWNAGNLGELEHNGIGYILNVTKEIDNFFPGRFNYHNIRLYDVETSDLLKHWEDTHRFLAKAKEAGSKALVHCKMGISRSAATVIAFAMKENRWSLEEALKYVKDKRKVINPNRGFRRQLEEYQGILDASNQRHNKLFRSKSESSLSTASSQDSNIQITDIHLHEFHPAADASHQPAISEETPMSPTLDPRRRSWSPNDKTSDALFSGSSTEDPSRSAISSPTYLDSPTAKYSGAGFTVGDKEDESDFEDDEDWEEIKFTVPEVPQSPTKTAENQFPPKGTVTQKILSIEGVTTSESNAGDDEGDEEQGTRQEGEDILMIPAESPGKFVVEGAITGESTEDDIVEATGNERVGEMETSGQVEDDQRMSDTNDEDELKAEEAGACARGSDGEEDGRSTPINYPMFLPLASADGRYAKFPLDVDVQSVTSSIAVTVDDLDDYIEKAHLEDDVDFEDDEDNDGSATPPVPDDQQLPGVQEMPGVQQLPGEQQLPGVQELPGVLEMPDEQQLADDKKTPEAGRVPPSLEEKDAFFTPGEGVPPVLDVQSQEPEDKPAMEESSGMGEDQNIASGATVSSQQQKEESGEKEVKETADVSTSQALSLDVPETELNTNNNSSTENSPRGVPVASSSPSTKDSLPQSTIKDLLSTPGSPESSDGYKTASSDAAETPSPNSYDDKDYPKGSVRSRARCYETQFSSEADDSSSAEKSKSKSRLSYLSQNSTESEELPKPDSKSPNTSLAEIETPEKESIPVVGSVQKQKKDIEKRLKSESESESSPPSVRSSKVPQDGSVATILSKGETSPPPVFESDKPFGALSSPSPDRSTKDASMQPKVATDKEIATIQSKGELSVPPPDGAAQHFASPSLQSLEKGIVKKLTKQLLSSDTTTLTKDFKKLVETSQVEDSLTKSDPKVTQKDDKNQDKSQQAIGKKEVPDNDRDNAKKLETATEEVSSDLSKKSESELASDDVVSDSAEPMRFGDEKIPLARGLVRRHTKDYEQRSVVEKQKEDVEMMEKTASEAISEESSLETSGAAGGEGDAASGEVEEESATAASVYPDEGSSWRVGDVRKQKKVFEKNGADGAALDMSKPSTVKMSQDSWDGKLTDEELENIKELGKIVLGRDGETSEEEEMEDEEEGMDTAKDEEGDPSGEEEQEGRLVNVKERIRKLDTGVDKPRPTHVDLKRSLTIAKMSNEKCSPTSARRRYERRKVIIRSKSGDDESASNQDTIKEADRESSSSSVDQDDNVLVDEPSQESNQELSGVERQRSKSEGGEKKTSYRETFEESTQDAAIQRVLNQAHKSLLQKPLPDTEGAESGARAKVTTSKPEQGKSGGATRKHNHGKSHPLSKLKAQSRKHPFYSTM